MDTAPLSGLVPMIHVADVERSAAFYRHLGFEIGHYVPRREPDGMGLAIRAEGA